ncbi:unnamed protein product [Protopolystoma xenopodis]|uniref:Uncharacterized protein n=1 Tax=Protopolystoma xenopodis TaxID=117903 RepID=A0A3S5A599_9PLAT|nr:unnamed protein product [Protopolystoma xenopodis]
MEGLPFLLFYWRQARQNWILLPFRGRLRCSASRALRCCVITLSLCRVDRRPDLETDLSLQKQPFFLQSSVRCLSQRLDHALRFCQTSPTFETPRTHSCTFRGSDFAHPLASTQSQHPLQ